MLAKTPRQGYGNGARIEHRQPCRGAFRVGRWRKAASKLTIFNGGGYRVRLPGQTAGAGWRQLAVALAKADASCAATRQG